MVVSTNKMVKITCFFKINKTSPINRNKIKFKYKNIIKIVLNNVSIFPNKIKLYENKIIDIKYKINSI